MASLARVPQQLNATSFAACLAHSAPMSVPCDLNGTRHRYALSAFDGLLLYLALYAGDRRPIINASMRLLAREKTVAMRLCKHGKRSAPPNAGGTTVT